MTPYGLLVIRIGLSGVLFWFGAQQLLDPLSWTGYVPEFAPALSSLSAHTIVLFNGAVEVAFGFALLLGIFTRVSAAVMGIHLALIALSLGLNAAGVRDWGLAFAFFGLALTGPGSLSVDDTVR